MAAIPVIRASNRLVASPHYAKILHEYNERFARDGKVSNKAFYEEIVAPLLPNYSLRSWYDFVTRFQTTAGLVAANAQLRVRAPSDVPLNASEQEGKLTTTLMTNQLATSVAIQSLLNIGAARAKELLENPHLLSAKEAVELMLKTMKAQDSRIHAVGKIREDNREQEKFERAFSGAQY